MKRKPHSWVWLHDGTRVAYCKRCATERHVIMVTKTTKTGRLYADYPTVYRRTPDGENLDKAPPCAVGVESETATC